MSRGHDRERRVKRFLEDDGWVVVRAAGSLGPVDLVALRADSRPRLIEVKSTAQTPYERFGPRERWTMRGIGICAGADVELAWWPAHKPLKWIPSAEWPADGHASEPAPNRDTP